MYRIMEDQYKLRTWVWTIDKKMQDAINMISADPTCYIQCFYGHFTYGIHNYFNRPCNYMTFLRDPIERVISEYYFLLMEPSHGPYVSKQIRTNNMTLMDYVSSKDEAFVRRTNNMQTSFISGKSNPQHADLQLAKENLRKHFTFGIAERFNESLFLFQKKFGWQSIQRYHPFFKNPSRPPKNQLSSEVLQKIKEKNELDILLYDEACMLFQKRIDSLDKASKKEMQQFLKNLK